MSCTTPEKKKEEVVESPPEPEFPTTGSIEVISPELNDLIATDAKIEVLTEEKFLWSEGPLWISELNSVIFSDVPDNKIYKWSEKDGLSVFLSPSGTNGQDVSPNESGSNGLTLNKEGKLVLAQHGNRQVSVMEASFSSPEPVYTALADKYEGKQFNSPNDVIFDKDGNMYFTDPPYGLKDQDDSKDKELSFNGVYKVDTDGNITIITDKLTRPNGLAFSPDEKTLYVANSDPANAIWMAYTFDENGAFTESVFFDATSMVPDKSGLPDGLRVDSNGIIYATGPGGVLVFSPEGKHLGTINTGKSTANCELVRDQKILYMTAHQQLMRIKLK
ncbi:MAG: SMP-30/gluconolactonase/LRE family protein [Bacteroidota bacterium]